VGNPLCIPSPACGGRSGWGRKSLSSSSRCRQRRNQITGAEQQDRGDPGQLLAEPNQAEAEVAKIRQELKKILSEALLR